MVAEVREARVDFLTIHGLLTPKTQEDYLKLVRLCYKFKKAVNVAIRLQLDGVNKSEGRKILCKYLNNWWYADSAWNYARMLVEGCKSNPRHVHVKSKFLISYAKSNERGNRNIRINDHEVRIRDSFSRSWLSFRHDFGDRFIKADKCTAKVVFREGKIYLHLSLPFELFRYGITFGELIASFDLNSDRVNVVIVDWGEKLGTLKLNVSQKLLLTVFPRTRLKTLG
jgi:predicted transposase